MKPRSLCAIALSLALPALGQSEPQLEPLVPNDAPWLQKNQKKRKKAPPKQAPAEQAQKPGAEPPLKLPPLAPLRAAVTRHLTKKSGCLTAQATCRDEDLLGVQIKTFRRPNRKG